MDIPLATLTSQVPQFKMRDPSVSGPIKSLSEHDHLFEAIAKHPQAGVFEDFTEDWALCLYYLASEVHRHSRPARKFCEEKGKGRQDDESEENVCEKLAERMNPWLESLERYARCFQYASQMVRTPPPSTLYMDYFRANLKRNMKAPNGEDASMYGSEGDPVPPNLIALDHVALSPIESLLVHRLMNPFIDFVGYPFRWLANKLKRCLGRQTNSEIDQKVVDGVIISGIAKVLASMLAALSLAAAIATLNSIKEGSKYRIIVMTALGLAYASPVQFFGQDSIPLYSLITSYFQTMVFFVGTTNVQNSSQ